MRVLSQPFSVNSGSVLSPTLSFTNQGPIDYLQPNPFFSQWYHSPLFSLACRICHHANANIDHGRCVISLSLISDVEYIFRGCSSHVTLDVQRTVFSIHPLIFHDAGPPYLSLLLFRIRLLFHFSSSAISSSNLPRTWVTSAMGFCLFLDRVQRKATQLIDGSS